MNTAAVSELRQMPHQAQATAVQGGVLRPRAVAVTSGKGGVGKTNVVINLAYAMAHAGKRVLVLDADLGLANVDILLNVRVEKHIGDVLDGSAHIEDVIVTAGKNLDVLPAGSGVRELVSLSDSHRHRLLEALEELQARYDVLLIDTAAGIGDEVLFFCGAATDVVVVLTPEPTSLADAYATIKVLRSTNGMKRFGVLVNQVRSAELARDAFKRLSGATDAFLDVGLEYLGYVYSDENIRRAVRERRLLLGAYPNSSASQCIGELARQLEAWQPPELAATPFFWRRLLVPDELA